MLTKLPKRIALLFALAFILAAPLIPVATTFVSASGWYITPGTILEPYEAITIHECVQIDDNFGLSIGIYNLGSPNNEPIVGRICNHNGIRAETTFRVPRIPGNYELRTFRMYLGEDRYAHPDRTLPITILGNEPTPIPSPTPEPMPDIAVTIKTEDTTLHPTESNLITVTVTNHSDFSASTLNTSIYPPEGTSFVPIEHLEEYDDAQQTVLPGHTFTPSVFTTQPPSAFWSFNTLAPRESQSVVFSIDVTEFDITDTEAITESGKIVATVTSFEADSDERNNTAEQAVTLVNTLRDTDNDTIGDFFDLCPETAGLIKLDGCPSADTDGDGLLDVNDSCPSTPGPEDQAGCPTYPDPLSPTPEGQPTGGFQSLTAPVTRQLSDGDEEAIPCTEDEDNEKLVNLVATTEFGLKVTKKRWWWREERIVYDPIFSVDYKWLNVCYKRNVDGEWFPMGIVTTDGQLKNDAQTIRNAADINIAAVGAWTQLNAGSSDFNAGAGSWNFAIDNVRFERQTSFKNKGVINVLGVSRTRAIFPQAMTGVGLNLEGGYTFEWNPENEPIRFNISMTAGRNGCMFFTGEPNPPAPEQCQAGNW